MLKEVPVQTIENIVYKDTIIYVQDSIKIEVPYEIIKEVIPSIDTSYIKTSIAESIAYVDTANKKLHHTLTQKGELKAKYDTIIKIQYINKIIEREKPIQVEIIKYKRDALFWVLALWAALCILIMALKIFVLK
jgi:hypothetical protein